MFVWDHLNMRELLLGANISLKLHITLIQDRVRKQCNPIEIAPVEGQQLSLVAWWNGSLKITVITSAPNSGP